MLADQHLALALSRRLPVLYVDPPKSALRQPQQLSRVVRQRSALSEIQPNLMRLTPLVQPFPTRRFASALTNRLSRLYLHWALHKIGARVRVELNAWPLHDVGRSVGARWRVFWAQDDFASAADLFGVNRSHIAAGERRLARDCDLVIAANPQIADRWQRAGAEVCHIPFGCDADLFRESDTTVPSEQVTLTGRIAGFVGHINARIDLSLFEAIADRGISLLLAGPRDASFEPGRFGALLDRSNVQWVGPQPFESLPSFVRHIDVGLVPYRDSAFNRGSFPLKTMEFLAAGRPVVSTDLPASRWLDCEDIAISDDPATFASLTQRWAAADPSADEKVRRQDFGARHSWDARAQAFIEAFDNLDRSPRD